MSEDADQAGLDDREAGNENDNREVAIMDDHTNVLNDGAPSDPLTTPVAETDINEAELVVLDPDHPLMVRFQNALNTHLLQQKEKFELELREIDADLKNKSVERENTGVLLYGCQQELAKQQVDLEQCYDDVLKTGQVREKEEAQLNEVRQLYKDIQNAVNDEKKKGADVLNEMENLALRIYYMNNAKVDIQSDITVMKRAADKAASDVSKSELTKQKQDFFVNRLVERVDKLKDEIGMYNTQYQAQVDDMKAAKDALMEAHLEMEAINIERRQLFQQWNSSLTGMRRRDEAYAAMQEALRQQQMTVATLKMEIEGIKKSTLSEQETNEKLTLILNKTENDLNTTKKQLNLCLSKQEALKAEYSTYSRMLYETDQSLMRTNAEKASQVQVQKALRQQMEMMQQKNKDAEEQVMVILRTQSLLEKSAQYSDKLMKKTGEMTALLEHQLVDEENKDSIDDLQILNMKTKLASLKKVKNEMEDEINAKNQLITNSSNDIKHRIMMVERKQTLIDQYNKKIDALVSAAGGVEIGPLEMTVNSMIRTLESQQQEIIQNQQQWLRRQTELVKVSKEKMEQCTGIETLRKRQMILTQKKLRAESEVNGENKEISDLRRELNHMCNDVIKLNTLIFKQSGVQEDLIKSNFLMENDIINALKDSERLSLLTQEKLETAKTMKDKTMEQLIEAERHIMLWEKKTQLARETKATVDRDVGEGEMRAMKYELHRMQVRYSELMRQQEKLIQEMEKSVSRRDTIVTKGDAQIKMAKNPNVVTKATFERQLLDTKKKIKQTMMNTSACEGEVKDLQKQQEHLSQKINDKQTSCNQFYADIDTAEGDIEKLLEQKHMNLSKLLSKQQIAKHYQQLKELKYKRINKSDNFEREINKQVERSRHINAAIQQLVLEYPYMKLPLRKCILLLNSRLVLSDTVAP